MNQKRVLLTTLNVFALLVLGLILQTGGAYLVNAAVKLLGETGGSAAASQYSDYMEAIRSIEPRQAVHVVFVGPLVEELVFRLIFLRAGKKVMPFWAANLVQAALFGLYHTVTIQRIYGFLMGLVIGCVFYYCPLIYKNAHEPENIKDEEMSSKLYNLPNSLLGILITFPLHMVINTSGLYLMPLFPADITIPAQLFIGSVCALIVAFVSYVLFRQSRRRSL